MRDFIQAATEKTAGLARQTMLYAGNAFDRVFRSASMVQAGQTPFETLHTDGLVSLRYYPPLQEDFIELDGITIPVERSSHRTPVVIRVRKHSGQQKLSLHGWSLGGMFTLFYSALSKDQHVRNAMVLGSPIDSHASGVLRLLGADYPVGRPGACYQPCHNLRLS